MKLQKMLHSPEDVISDNGENVVLTHVVDEIELGGEFTVCGRAIVGSVLKIEGWETVGKEFKGKLSKCDCKDCIRIIRYFKSLK